MSDEPDIWHDDDGVWRDVLIDGVTHTVGPFDSEGDARRYVPPARLPEGPP